MGNPIHHSRSPQIHTLFAQQTGQRLYYDTIFVELGGLEQAIGNFYGSGGRGLNITVPFKEEAAALADSLSERASLAGAVNTLHFDSSGKIIGDNTDGAGLLQDLQHNLQQPLAAKRLLILGAGGAVRGILAPLLHCQPANITIANRSVGRAESLQQQFSAVKGHCDFQAGSFTQIEAAPYDLIINATAASLQGELPPLPAACVASHTLCYDLMYAPQPTPFMRWGEAQGAARAVDGLGMLVEQAAAAFAIWRGVMPQTAAVIAALRQP
ncbi:MAG: shikimate dehydrogenase [Gammaproteobacteria bacterium]|nr:shikimate dehydrogenase [Gammaproteobacteria bacterium]